MKKENETFLTSQKKVKFQLQPINYNFFMKNEDEDEDHRGNGGGGFYNNYIAWMMIYYLITEYSQYF